MRLGRGQGRTLAGRLQPVLDMHSSDDISNQCPAPQMIIAALIRPTRGIPDVLVGTCLVPR
jgi:hypothetical protein